MTPERGRPRPPVAPGVSPGAEPDVSSKTEPTSIPQHRGWHDRGYLPHFDGKAVIQSITYRLADSLPIPVLLRMEKEIAHMEDEERSRLLRRRIDAWLDTGHGSCLLSRPEAAEVVVDAWHFFDRQRYDLEAWVVMPNHVHLMVRVREEHPLSEIIHSWKSFTAKRIAHLTKTTGTIWQAEYWDRFVRDAEHFDRVMTYIHDNPVRAGLATTAGDWKWSSAYRGGR
jgi:REP element-mobilizing transposase RayT